MLYLEVAPLEEFMRRNNFIAYPDEYFFAMYEDWMIESDFSRRVISTIDWVEMKGSTVMESIAREGFSVEGLSTGTKNLINCKYFDNLNRFSFMGPNCHPFLFEIAKEKDVYMGVTGFIGIKEESMQNNPVCIVNTGKVYTNADKLYFALTDVKVELGMGI